MRAFSLLSRLIRNLAVAATVAVRAVAGVAVNAILAAA
eukprot:COSAG06_NODE_26566_length_612_cov_0.824561_1_plen_37_part_10